MIFQVLKDYLLSAQHHSIISIWNLIRQVICSFLFIQLSFSKEKFLNLEKLIARAQHNIIISVYFNSGIFRKMLQNNCQEIVED